MANTFTMILVVATVVVYAHAQWDTFPLGRGKESPRGVVDMVPSDLEVKEIPTEECLLDRPKKIMTNMNNSTIAVAFPYEELHVGRVCFILLSQI
ncbi:hypothetical protein DPMN_157527 [Dreissena polymorpha]|uniref:Uncharacterized protein n=1 Tax=Dreissena polymorpha TaxID=45954 RepID=A0A9D4IMC6_DREPO|nr:hypothetical protein DPMN_157527 [Dreissena polymorpha]